MATVFHGYCKFLQQKTNGMSKQLPNKSNKTQWVCPKMGHKIHRNHHYYVIFPLHFSKRYAPFWDTPELSALKLCQTFCTTEGAGLHHLVAMCSMCVHATKNKTCINSINMCNAMQRQGSKHFLLRFAFSTGSSSFVLKNIEFQSAACFRHLCAREWLKKMFADKTELWEHEMQSETTRKPASLLLAPLLQRGPGVLAESFTSHSDAWSCKRLSFYVMPSED